VMQEANRKLVVVKAISVAKNAHGIEEKICEDKRSNYDCKPKYRSQSRITPEIDHGRTFRLVANDPIVR